MPFPIYYIDRATKKVEEEKIYGRWALHLLYGEGIFSRFFSFFLLPLIAKVPLFSKGYGWLQSRPFSKKKIVPFLRNFSVDPREFAKKVEDFSSFQDFFTRKLRPEARPICPDRSKAIWVADGRYLFYPYIKKEDFFTVKGNFFSLPQLLQEEELAKKYEGGVMVIARLCPHDYHRFHFPCEGTPHPPYWINGYLYSVNPWALKKNIHIFTQNKRIITLIDTPFFGRIAYIEIGATYVGNIQQTFIPGKYYQKGEEKGFFAFGGSSIVLLFEPNTLSLDEDLVELSKQGIEIRGKMGESLGKSLKKSFG